MYLPRQQIAQLYNSLLKTTHSSSAPVLILTALTVDSICATRILTSLLKRDYIPHTIKPIAGYADLLRVGGDSVLPLTRQRGGDGGTVVCLGLGGSAAMEEVLGLDGAGADGETGVSMQNHGVEVWIIDARRPWNLENLFGTSVSIRHDDNGIVRRPGVSDGKTLANYKPGQGGVIVWDDNDIEMDLRAEKEAFLALQGMPDITENDVGNDEDEVDDPDSIEASEHRTPSSVGQKRKRHEAEDTSDVDYDSEAEDEPHRRRRRSNSSGSIPIPSSPGGNPLSAQYHGTSTPPTMPSSPPKLRAPSEKQLRRQLLTLRKKHENTLLQYYGRGSQMAEPVSSMMYSLASELGREDNELLWLAIVGISSLVSSPSGIGRKANQVREVLRDEVRRLNPVPLAELQRSQSSEAIIPTTARSTTDTSIRLSPEPRFLLIRHWSLYDAMLHSPYLATRLHVWSDSGRKRLHKLLAKMGISLQEAGKGFLHMDSEIKRTLRSRILKFVEQYNLHGLVPGGDARSGMDDWGFVRSWGWRGTLSAEDVAVVVGAILEVGTEFRGHVDFHKDNRVHVSTNYNARMRNPPTPPHSSDDGHERDKPESHNTDYITQRFFQAYDALAPSSGLTTLLQNLPVAQNLYKAILRVGSAIISKQQIRHLRSFRMAVIKDGPDVPLFTHPGALARLASWISDAMTVIESEKGRRSNSPGANAWILATLDEERDVFVVIGLGGGEVGISGAKRFRSKAEIKARREKKAARAVAKAAHAAEKKRKREERRALRRERNAANNLFDDEDDDEEIETESDSSEDSSDSDSDSDGSDSDGDSVSGGAKRKRKGRGLNRFGLAFQETVEQTGARVRLDSFEHSVVEVAKEDLGRFLENLSNKAVVG
jgi:cell division control protein 45